MVERVGDWRFLASMSEQISPKLSFYKKVVFVLLFLLSCVFLGLGIWQYRLFYEWLEPRHVEGLVLMLLVAFGLTTLFVPVVVRQEWQTSSVRDVAVHYLVVFGLMLAALTAVFTLLWLLGWVLFYLRVYPLLMIALIAILWGTGYILSKKNDGRGE